MRFSSLSAAAAAISVALAVPASHYVVHEKRAILPPGWAASHKMHADSVIPVRIGLTQSNMDKIEDYLMSVSDPESAQWGKHWSAKQIAHTFAPSKETVEAVRDWLVSHGISEDRVEHSASLGWLKVDTTVAEAEKLLQTEYHMYEHATGARQVGCSQYKVPASLQQHIDFITPTLHFDAKVKRDGKKEPATASEIIPIVQKGRVFANIDTLEKKLKNCTDYITPQCLRALYEIPTPSSNGQTNPLGIVEYTTQSYYQPDLDLFFSTYSKKQQQTTPNLKSIDGGFVSDVSLGFGGNGESNLDFEYSMSLANPIAVNLYQAGDAVEGASFNNFLDAIDGSYCTFEGGDAPYDPKYPDPYTQYEGAYEGPEACGKYPPPKVVSTSYSYPSEYDLPAAYQIRQCQEYAKLGLMGTSVLYSSGDSGVGEDCIGANSTFGNPNFADGPKSRFTVGFPGTCPYVTGVGATEVKNNTSVLDANPEVAANVLLPQADGSVFDFSSGGGFSDLFSTPAYQKSAIKQYFKNHKPSYNANRYNNTGMSRGVPDVSANGANYVISVNGTFSLVYGTSASSPTFAAIIAIINEQRHANGKGPIGFLNPMLYKNPEVLNDIVGGRNPGCSSQGFTAVTGWDPLTGLGTPNTPRMLELFLKMA